MRKEMAITKDLRRAVVVVDNLSRSNGNERMSVWSGVNGSGKTTAIDHVIDKTNGIALRIKIFSSELSLLSDLATELRCPEKIKKSNRKSVIYSNIVEKLNENPCPLFIDEVDRLLMPSNRHNGEKIMELLRDIHDEVKVPIIFVGEENSAISIQENGRFARRVAQWIEFKGIDIQDARTVADTLCEVAVADDLLKHLHQESAAGVGRIVIGLGAIERHGKATNCASVDLVAWGNNKFFYDQSSHIRKQVKR